jgi:hypothetical protein
VDNKIQDFYIDYYSANNKSYFFGPNKQSLLNGPCIRVDNRNFVSLDNRENGLSQGSTDDYFQIPQPIFDYNGVFCDEYAYSARDKKQCKLIPNTKNIIYTSAREYNTKGDRKYWITLVDLSVNKIVFSYGNYAKPINTSKLFKLLYG